MVMDKLQCDEKEASSVILESIPTESIDTLIESGLNSANDDSFDDDEIFPEPSKDDRDYVSINITDTDDDDPSVVEEESQETETPSEESDEKE